MVPLVMVAMNVVYTLSAYPFGKLEDSTSHGRLLVIGRRALPVSELWPSLRCVATRFAAEQAGAQQVGAHYDYTIAIPLLLVFLSDFQRHDPMRWAGHCRQLCFPENSCKQICFLFLKSLISLIFFRTILRRGRCRKIYRRIADRIAFHYD